MKLLQRLIFVLLLGSGIAAQANCPLGAKEDHLTIERVMRNFGRFIGAGEMIAIKGIVPYEKITNEDFDVAIEKIGWVIDCAQAVLDDPNDNVIPTDAKKKTGAERQEHVDDYLYFMTEFRDGLKEYQGMLRALREQPANERNYQRLHDKYIELNKLIDHAHKKV